MQNGATDKSSHKTQGQASNREPMFQANSNDASNGYKASRFDQDRKLMEVREIKNQANSAEPQHSTKTAEGPQHEKVQMPPAHIGEGETFKDRWRKAPVRWKRGVVAAACAAALVVAVPLGAMAANSQGEEPMKVQDIETPEAAENTAPEKQVEESGDLNNAETGGEEASDIPVKESVDSPEGQKESGAVSEDNAADATQDETTKVEAGEKASDEAAGDGVVIKAAANDTLDSVSYKVIYHAWSSNVAGDIRTAQGTGTVSLGVDYDESETTGLGKLNGNPTFTEIITFTSTQTPDNTARVNKDGATYYYTSPSGDELGLSLGGLRWNTWTTSSTSNHGEIRTDSAVSKVESRFAVIGVAQINNEIADTYDGDSEEWADEAGAELSGSSATITYHLYAAYLYKNYNVAFLAGNGSTDTVAKCNSVLHLDDKVDVSWSGEGDYENWSDFYGFGSGASVVSSWQTTIGNVVYKDSNYLYQYNPDTNGSYNSTTTQTDLFFEPYLLVNFDANGETGSAITEEYKVRADYKDAVIDTSTKTNSFSSDKQLIGWSFDKNATKTDIDDPDNTTAVGVGGTLYYPQWETDTTTMKDTGNTIYAIWEDTDECIFLDYNGLTPDDATIAPSKVPATINKNTEGQNVSYTTNLPDASTGITATGAGGKKKVLVGWTVDPTNTMTDVTVYGGYYDADSNPPLPTSSVKTTTRDDEGTHGTLYAVWDDAVTIEYAMATDDDNYSSTGSVTVASEIIGRESSKKLNDSKYSYEVGGSTASSNDTSAAGKVFRYWKAADDVTAAVDDKTYTTATFSPDLSGTSADVIPDSVSTLKYVAYLRPARIGINMYPNGGTTSDGQTTDYTLYAIANTGEDTYTAAVPTAAKTGTTYLGWDTPSSVRYNGGNNETWNTDAVPTSLSAQYDDPNQHVTVKFNYNISGTSNPDDQTSTTGSLEVTMPDVPARAGYTFLGWSTKQAEDSPENELGTVGSIQTYNFKAAGSKETYSSDTTLFAIWDKNVTVHFLANNGKNNIGTGAVDANAATTSLTGSDIDKSATFGRVYGVNGAGNYEAVTAKYTLQTGAFLGWTTGTPVATNGGVPSAAARTASKAPTTADLLNATNGIVNYYANFGISVTMNLDGGLCNNSTDAVVNYYYDASGASLNAAGTGTNQVSKSGKSFIGWNKHSAIAESALTQTTPSLVAQPGAIDPAPTNNVTYYAVWDTPIVITFAIGDSTKGEFYDIASSTTLTDATVVYEANKMTSSTLSSSITMTNSSPRVDGKKVAALEYAFKNWKLTSGTAGVNDDVNTNPMSLTYDSVNGTGWGDTRAYEVEFTDGTETTYTVTFDYNGGQDLGGQTSDQRSIAYDSTIDLRTDAVAITNTGKTLLGWTLTKADPLYDSTLVTSHKVTSDVTFYAVWDDAVDLTFKVLPASGEFGTMKVEKTGAGHAVITNGSAGSGEVHVTLAKHKSGANAVRATAQPKSGYELSGSWQGTANGATVDTGDANILTVGNVSEYNSNATYTAQLCYKHTFDYNGGENAGGETHEKSGAVTSTGDVAVAFPADTVLNNLVWKGEGSKKAVAWGLASNSTYGTRITETVNANSPQTYYVIWDSQVDYTYGLTKLDDEYVGAISQAPVNSGWQVGEVTASESITENAQTAPAGYTVTANVADGYEFAYFTCDGEQMANTAANGVTLSTQTHAGQTVNAGASLKPQKTASGLYESHDYSAVFKKIDYKVQYMTEVGASPSNVIARYNPATTYNATVGSDFPAFAGAKADDGSPDHKAGYKFLGWSYNGTDVIADENFPATFTKDEIARIGADDNGTLKLYPVWEERTYTVTFANTALNPAVHTGLKYGEKPLVATEGTAWVDAASGLNGTLTDPREQSADSDGYEFVGWYKTDPNTDDSAVQLVAKGNDALLVSDINGDETVTELTIYAKFRKKTVPITYIYDWNGDVRTTTESGEGVFGESITLDEGKAWLHTKDGHHISGWAFGRNAAEALVSEVDVDGDYTVKAHDNDLWAVWTPNQYKVHFDKNGGDGQMDDQTFTWIDTDAAGYPLKKSTFTRTGYQFAGWKIQDGYRAGESLEDEQVVKNLTKDYQKHGTEAYGEVTLVAQWDKLITITYDTNGANETAAELFGANNASVQVLANSEDGKFTPPTVSSNQVHKTGSELPASVVWSTEQSGVGGTEYGAGLEANTASPTALNNDITLYLKWANGTSEYQIVRWLQTYDENGENPTYVKETLTEQEAREKGLILSAATGAQKKVGDTDVKAAITAAGNADGYHLSSNTTDEDMVTVTANTKDGDGVVQRATLDVYYDRDTFSYTYNHVPANGYPEDAAVPADGTTANSAWGLPITLASVPTKVGYTVTGWTVKDDSDAEIEAVNGSFVMPKSNVTITLTWDKVGVRAKLASGDTDIWNWESNVISGTYGDKIAVSDYLTADEHKKLTDTNHDIDYWDQYKMNVELDADGNVVSAAKGGLVKSKVDPDSVELKEDSWFEAHIAESYVVKWVAGSQGTFETKSSSAHPISNPDTMQAAWGNATNGAPTGGALTHNPGYTFKGWQYTLGTTTTAADGTTQLLAGTPYTIESENPFATGSSALAKVPQYVNQNVTYTAVWEPESQNLKIDMTKGLSDAGDSISFETSEWAYSSSGSWTYTADGNDRYRNVYTIDEPGDIAWLPSDAEFTAADYELVGWVTAEDYGISGWSNNVSGMKPEGVSVEMPANPDGSNAMTIIPVVKEKTSTFTYVADPAAAGAITPIASETINRVTGVPTEVTAKAKSVGYEFKEWQLVSATQETAAGTGQAISPAKSLGDLATVDSEKLKADKKIATSVASGSRQVYPDAATYKAVMQPRTMQVEVVAAENATLKKSGTAVSTSDTFNADYGASLDEALAAITASSTFAGTYTVEPDEGYQLNAPAYTVTVTPIKVDENGAAVIDGGELQYDESKATTVTTDNPGSIEAAGKVKVELRIVASPAYVKYYANTAKYADATGETVTTTGTTGAEFTTNDGASFHLLGHHVTGWTTNSDGTGTAYGLSESQDGSGNAYKMAAGTTELYAQYSPNKVTYVPNANGGTGTAVLDNPETGDMAALKKKGTSDDSYYGDTVVAPSPNADELKWPTPNKEFLGWSKDPTATSADIAKGSDIEIADATGDNSTIRIYAVWGDVQYKLAYDANSASATGAMVGEIGTWDESAGNAGTYTVLGNGFTNGGYEFMGWNTQANGLGTPYAAGDTITLDAITVPVTTLYAQWREIQSYDIVFMDGATQLSTDANVQDVKTFGEGSKPTDPNRVFKGWFTQDEGAGDEITFASGTSTITARTLAEETDAKNHIESDSGKKVIRLYANMKALNVEMTIDPNDSDDADHPATIVDSGIDNPDGTTTLDEKQPWADGVKTPEVSRPGYDLVGWETPGSDEVKESDPFAEFVDPEDSDDNGVVPMTIRPIWQEKDASITYTTNDEAWGKVALQSGNDFQASVTETTKAAKNANPVGAKAQAEPGYHFVNWMVNADPAPTPMTTASQDGIVLTAAAGSTEYSQDESIMPGLNNQSVLEPLTYTAMFAANDEAMVTFDSNGGNGTVNPVTVLEGQSIDLPNPIDSETNEPIEKEHYTFDGWQLPDGTVKQPGDPVQVDGNMNVKAVWTPVNYKVTVPEIDGPDGKTPGAEDEVPYGSTLPEDFADVTTNPYRELVGWHVKVTDDEGNVISEEDVYKPIDEIPIVGDTELTPIWEATDAVATFDPNGGTGAVDPITATAGDDITLPEGDKLTRDHYTFEGWELPDGTVAQPGDKHTLNENETIKAKWAPKTYTVVVKGYDDPTYGKVTPGDFTGTFGTSLPGDMTKITPADGKELIGWHVIVRDDDGNIVRDEVVYKPLDELTIEGDMELSPVWGDKKEEAPAAETKVLPAGRSATPITGDPLVLTMMGVGSVAALSAIVMVIARNRRKSGGNHGRK